MDAEPTANAQALARVTPTAAPSLITTPEEYNEIVASLDDKTSHVLSPMAGAMSGFLPGYALIRAEVQIDPYIDPESGRGLQTYFNGAWMKGKKQSVNADETERALNLIGLRRICSAAGIVWDPATTRRVDDGGRAHYWEFKAVGSYRTPVGEYLTVDASTSLDLADGSAEIGYWTLAGWRAAVARGGVDRAKEQFHGWSDVRVLQQRIAGHRQAESKAKNAAIRDFGIPQVFTVKQLKARKFIIFRTVFLPDTTNPEIALLVARHALEGRAVLYPAAALLPRESRSVAVATPRVVDTELVDDLNDVDDNSPLDAAVRDVRVVDVREHTGNTNGRDWKLFIVSLSDGRSGGTLDADLAARARTFRKERVNVVPSIEPGRREGQYTLTALNAAVAAESAPPAAVSTSTQTATVKAAPAAVTVVVVQPWGPNEETGREGYLVTFSDGRQALTDDPGTVESCRGWREKRTPLSVDTPPSETNPDVLVIANIQPVRPAVRF